MVLDDRLDEALDELVDAITESDRYKKYKTSLKQVKIWPELMDRINEFRNENFEIQTLVDDAHLIDRVEDFERKYEGFRSDDRVNDFLAAELAFNRLMQEVYNRIIDGIEYE